MKNRREFLKDAATGAMLLSTAYAAERLTLAGAQAELYCHGGGAVYCKGKAALTERQSPRHELQTPGDFTGQGSNVILTKHDNCMTLSYVATGHASFRISTPSAPTSSSPHGTAS